MQTRSFHLVADVTAPEWATTIDYQTKDRVVSRDSHKILQACDSCKNTGEVKGVKIYRENQSLIHNEECYVTRVLLETLRRSPCTFVKQSAK